jgi:hypothetical protein
VFVDEWAEGGSNDNRLQELQKLLKEVLDLEDDHRLAFVELHDAYTSMAAHEKPLPKGALKFKFCLWPPSGCLYQ